MLGKKICSPPPFFCVPSLELWIDFCCCPHGRPCKNWSYHATQHDNGRGQKDIGQLATALWGNKLHPYQLTGPHTKRYSLWWRGVSKLIFKSIMTCSGDAGLLLQHAPLVRLMPKPHRQDPRDSPSHRGWRVERVTSITSTERRALIPTYEGLVPKVITDSRGCSWSLYSSLECAA